MPGAPPSAAGFLLKERQTAITCLARFVFRRPENKNKI